MITKTLETLPGSKFTRVVTYEVVRPLERSEVWKYPNGETKTIDNKRGQLFAVKRADSDEPPIIWCFADLEKSINSGWITFVPE